MSRRESRAAQEEEGKEEKEKEKKEVSTFPRRWREKERESVLSHPLAWRILRKRGLRERTNERVVCIER